MRCDEFLIAVEKLTCENLGAGSDLLDLLDLAQMRREVETKVLFDIIVVLAYE
jgi:hypothetical protein